MLAAPLGCLLVLCCNPVQLHEAIFFRMAYLLFFENLTGKS